MSLQFYSEIKFATPTEARHQILEDKKYTHLRNKSINKMINRKKEIKLNKKTDLGQVYFNFRHLKIYTA